MQRKLSYLKLEIKLIKLTPKDLIFPLWKKNLKAKRLKVRMIQLDGAGLSLSLNLIFLELGSPGN